MEQTLALLECAHQGDKKARDKLIEDNVGLVWNVARRFKNRGVELEDLNLLAYTKFGDFGGKPTFVNTMLTPENKILLICSLIAAGKSRDDSGKSSLAGICL